VLSMLGESRWTPGQKMLYVAVAPVAVLASGVLLFSLANPSNGSTQAAPQPTRAQVVARAAEEQRDELRKQFRQCLDDMGADVNPSPFRTRFSRRPDMSKVRDAVNVCSTLLRDGAGQSAPATARRPAGPPVA